MAKGRKRKSGKRTASGRLSRSKSERAKRGIQDVRAVALQQPHRAWLGESRRADQRAESEVGRLCLAGRISEAEYWVAERWRRLILEFHQVLASPVCTGSPLSKILPTYVEAGDVAGECDAAECAESEEERRERVLVQHRAAMRAIGRLGADAREVFTSLEAIVMHGRAAGEEYSLRALRAGLAQLGRLWRITESDDDRPLRGSRSEKPRWDHEVREVIIVRK